MSKIEIVVEDGVNFCSGYQNLEEAQQIFSEAKVSSKSVPTNCLKIRQIVGYANEPTSNDNIYLTEDLNESFTNRSEDLKNGRVWGTFGSHPTDRAYINPDEVSHIITKVWVDESKKVLTKEGKKAASIWTESVILNTSKGKDYQALILGGASIGNSIRGTAVRNNKNQMKHYTFEGFDCVGMPSTGVYAGVDNPVYKAELLVESFEKVSESTIFNQFKSLHKGGIVMNKDGVEKSLSGDLKVISESLKSISTGNATATDLVEVALKMGTLEQRVESIQRLSENKDIEIVELKTRFDELKGLKDVLESEKNDSIKELDSFKSVVEELKTQVEQLEIDLTNKDGVEDKAVKIIEEMKDRLNELKSEAAIAPDMPIGTIEDLRDTCWKHEALMEGAIKYIYTLETHIEQIRDYALKLESFTNNLVNEHEVKLEEVQKTYNVIEGLRDIANGVNNITSKSPAMNQYIEHLMDKQPKLKHFSEELKQCESLAAVQTRVTKYLGLIDSSSKAEFIMESANEKTPSRKGIEKFIGRLR